ncbi:SDR family oxidoreductase [Candidatus Haliotispira prima]|uniref:SDR family oxidoreductase n=1 Tax=Candidatus Haliotispira prima TaxID=3034016 RepID=A0ABY8MFA3_9SPIO|nr:SDR family oxidoreductase [Candidatus Haliotispira prima]
MFTINMQGKNVLITGGTKGIGLGAAKYFGQAGAQVYLTYKWGSADMDAIEREFSTELKAKAPIFIQADVSREEETEEVMAEIAKYCDYLDVFISNVGFALKTDSLDDYKKRSLYKTLDYSSWPMIDYCRKAKKQFGKYPRYVLGVSSDGPDHYYPGYDFVAASKAMLEFFGRYLAVHLRKEGSSVNVVRFGTVKTESFEFIFGDEFFEFSKENGVNPDCQLVPDDCGRVLFAMCSGLFDALNGQLLQVDHGLPFQDNLMNRFSFLRNRDSPDRI